MTLASTYAGTVVLGRSNSMSPEPLTDFFAGLNRGHDDITNTIAAAKVAKSKMGNLLAIELGNEPECQLLFHPSVPPLTYISRLGQRRPTHSHQRRHLDTRY